MTSIPKHLAEGIDLLLSCKLARIDQEEDRWVVTNERGERFASRALLMTPPVPQAIELLAAGNLPLPEQVRHDLGQITYSPCLALLALLPGRSLIPEPGGLSMPGEPIAWMADNNLKGVSSGPGAAVTIHAGPRFSSDHWETGELEVTRMLLDEAAPWLGTSPVRTQLHRWRYSRPTTSHPDRCLVLREAPALVIAGDAFGGPRVEGAALSGLAAGAALIEILNGCGRV
jgi:predicted NAD/FAD-dependent oxidoreductase